MCMETFLTTLSTLLKYATFKRVLTIGLLIIFLLAGYIGYRQAPAIANLFTSNGSRPFVFIPTESEAVIGVFMKKHTEVAYLAVVTFKFEKNTRLPIYRTFNDEEIKKFIYERLNGGDGAIPIFIKNDESNNNQIISIISGETNCAPFSAGGLSRSIPESIPKFHTSCRAPLPPVFGDGIRGYVVAHVNGKMLSTYEIEVLKLDLILLSKLLNEQTD
jgi:hypothetical protein